MSASVRVIIPDPSSLAGLTDHCSPAQARRLRRPMLRTISSASSTVVLTMLVLIVAMFAYSYGWLSALLAGVAYLLLVVVLVARVLQTAVPSRPQRRRARRATYVLQDGTTVIEARATGPGRGVVELCNHAKLPGTSSDRVRAMRRILVNAILEANPRITLRATTRVHTVARLYAEDFDAVAETLGLDQRSLTRPVRARERMVGLRTEVRLRLEPG